MDDIEEPVVTIRRNYLDNEKLKENTKKCYFQGQSARAKGWFNIDHGWLEEKNCTCEPDLFINLFKNNIEGQEMETYQIFVVL